MMRRGLCFLIFFLFFCSSAVAQVIPPHMNFEEADEDLYAIVAFLADTKLLAEESLEYSLRSNCTMSFNQTVEMTYSSDDLDVSLVKSDELSDKLSYSSDVLGEIKEKAGSYRYLKDILLPLKDLGYNVSSFVTYHKNILLNFTQIVNFINNGGNETEALFSLADVRSGIVNARKKVHGIEVHTDEISRNFSTAMLKTMIPLLSSLLDRYEQYSDFLVGFFSGIEPVLLLYVEEHDMYLGEDIYAYGYFMAGSGFIANYSIHLLWDEEVIETIYTDDKGRYDVVRTVSLDTDPGTYNVTTSTTYNSTVYYSNSVFVTIHKIPTHLVFSTDKKHYYLNESIYFSGRLLDYKNSGLQADITLHVAGSNISLMTDDNGRFIYIFNKTLSFRVYPSYVSFDPEKTYIACTSKTIDIYVDTPTDLTIYTFDNNVVVGADIKLYGWLRSAIDNLPLSNKTIDVFLSDKKVGSVNTNETGFYNFTYLTGNLNTGVYSIYSRYNSDDVEWRSTSSKVLTITLVTSFVQKISENLFFVAIVMIIVVTVLLLFIFRKRLRLPSRFRKPSSQTVIPQSTAISSKPRSRGRLFGKKPFTIEISGKKTGDFNDTIISRYQSLMSLLSRVGIVFHPSSTHLDIRNTMIGEGFPQDPTETITRTFEVAKYSPYRANKEDVKLFDENIVHILNNLGV